MLAKNKPGFELLVLVALESLVYGLLNICM